MKKESEIKQKEQTRRKIPMGYSQKKTYKKASRNIKKKTLSTKGKKKSKHLKMKKSLQEWGTNVLFMLIVLLVGLFLIRMKSHQVSGHSMEPTLKDRDRIVVLKNQHPTRYEMITFEPKDAPGDSYVKRVIGIPGDVIWVEGNALYINQQAENNPKNIYGRNLSAVDLPDGTIRIAISEAVAKELVSYYKIPDDTYFVQGDNRNHSDDSRVMGLIDSKQIEGVVAYRYYPFNKVGVVR